MSHLVETAVARLEDIVGGNHMITEAAELSAREACGMRPSAAARPADAAQAAEILRFAAVEKLAVIPCSGGTKLSLGFPPTRYDLALDLSRMNRVLAYDPQDLTLGVEPGVRIEDLHGILAEKKQFLPLAVPFSDRATIGGVVAANSSSPLRHAYGSVRDFCLGMEFVTGEGAQAKSGGRVVKNVTGYDLHKLLIGSLGTLAVITRINFRTFPLPPAKKTFVANFASAEFAFDFCHEIAHSVLTPQIVEVADPEAAGLVFTGESKRIAEPAAWSVILTAAGPPAVVERHARELGRMAGAAKAAGFTQLDGPEESSVLDRVREFPRLALKATPSALIFRINVIPTAIPSLLQEFGALAQANSFHLATLTRAFGIVYAAFVPEPGIEASPSSSAQLAKEVLHLNAIPDAQAHSMLEWAPAEVKRLAGDIWGPARADLPLMWKLKNAFDPHYVLSPGRFAMGI